MKRVLLLIPFLISFLPAFSQETTVKSDTLRKDALNVFMEASDFMKKEIPFINYVRDLKVADVYVISTDEHTGSGGSVTTFFIIGQGKYQGMADTLKCPFAPDETHDIQRAKKVKILKLGLMRYVAKTPLSQFMNINFSEPLSQVVSTDTWNNWVYAASLHAYSQGQKTYNYGYMDGTVSANRITEESKFQSSLTYDLATNRNVYLDTVYRSSTHDEYLHLSYVKSITDHWSAGGLIYMQTSSYSNFDLSTRIMPSIEYNIYPYAESTRRQLRFLYRAGMEINKYSELTIRNKLSEKLARQSMSTTLTVIQKWGSINSSLTWSNYFFDWSYNNLRLNTDANLRIIKGLSFTISGSFALVNDQISLPLGEANLQDILLQRKMQATDYSYYTSFGFTYTFGSIYNNVVNPRFGN
jgi:ferric iron reductase protein FhuF